MQNRNRVGDGQIDGWKLGYLGTPLITFFATTFFWKVFDSG
jgi:hypothetical protein